MSSEKNASFQLKKNKNEENKGGKLSILYLIFFWRSSTSHISSLSQKKNWLSICQSSIMHTLILRPLPWALYKIQTMQSERTQAPNIMRWGKRLATYWISWQPALWDCRLRRFNLKQLEPFPPQRRQRYVYFQQRCYPFTARWLRNIYAQLLQATNETLGAVDRETHDRQTAKENSARRIKLLTRHFPEKKKKRLPNRISQAFLRVMQKRHKWGEDKSTSEEERTTEKTLFEAQG